MTEADVRRFEEKENSTGFFLGERRWWDTKNMR